MEEIQHSLQYKQMKILFITTAHNSLSQRLFLALEATGEYAITIEYAVSEAIMIEAFEMSQPDLIICPFLTSKVPAEIYNAVMTLIIHPGPPGDAGPSALDWLLMGDDGSEKDSVKQLMKLNMESEKKSRPRTAWGVTVIQATEEFDAGPVWGFENFYIDIDEPGLTKSSLYRGPVTRAAIAATTRVIHILRATQASSYIHSGTPQLTSRLSPSLRVRDSDVPCVTVPNTWTRPMLKPAERDFDITRHTAKQISRRIRCADSQPGVLSKIFKGPALFIYGGIIDDLVDCPKRSKESCKPGDIIMTRNQAVCIYTCDKKGVWITHIRRVKRKVDASLWPKVPAVSLLLELGLMTVGAVTAFNTDVATVNGGWALSNTRTFQEVWIESDSNKRIVYIYFEFYNGAMSTRQCKLLYDAIQYASKIEWKSGGIQALVLMGGSYFSNGIALNVIEASPDPAQESWENINAIDDIVSLVFEISRDHKVLTVAGVRGNAAAGGVALMAACDYVLCGQEVVLNPAYRAIGLSGSEFHTLSYPGRCGKAKAQELLQSMLPISPESALKSSLVDCVLRAAGTGLDVLIRKQVVLTLDTILGLGAGTPENIANSSARPGVEFWTSKPGVIDWKVVRDARELELKNMSMDFWGPRSQRYHSRRFDFVRKVKAEKTPLRFAKHRRTAGVLDLEEKPIFDSVVYWKKVEESGINRSEDSISNRSEEDRANAKAFGVQVSVAEMPNLKQEKSEVGSQAEVVDHAMDDIVSNRGGGINGAEEVVDALDKLNIQAEGAGQGIQQNGHQFSCYYNS